MILNIVIPCKQIFKKGGVSMGSTMQNQTKFKRKGKKKKGKKSCCGSCSATQVTQYILQTIHLHLQVFIVMSHCSGSRLCFLLPTSASLPSPVQTCLSSQDMAYSVSFCLPCHTIFAYHNSAQSPSTTKCRRASVFSSWPRAKSPRLVCGSSSHAQW